MVVIWTEKIYITKQSKIVIAIIDYHVVYIRDILKSVL